MTTNYPASLDTFTTHGTGDTIEPSYDNNQQDALIALETKLGVDNSAVTTTIDYKLKSTSSIDVGHKHNLSVSINDVVITTPSDGEVLTYSSGIGKWINSGTSAPDASTSVKGVSKMSVAPASASNPIAVGDNDGRVPTQNENDALAGSSGSPSSSNKYITEDDVSSAGASGKVVRATGTALPALDGSNLTSVSSGLISASATDSSAVTNTVTETTVGTIAIPAGVLGTNRAVRFRATFQADWTGTNGNLTFRAKYGGTTIASEAVTGVSGNPSQTSYITLEGMLIANGATGSQKGNALAFSSNQVSGTTSSNSPNVSASIDSTTSQNLTFTLQWSTASANLTAKLTSFVVQKVT